MIGTYLLREIYLEHTHPVTLSFGHCHCGLRVAALTLYKNSSLENDRPNRADLYQVLTESIEYVLINKSSWHRFLKHDIFLALEAYCTHWSRVSYFGM